MTFWRYVYTTRILYYIRYGPEPDSVPKRSLDDFRHNSNKATDGTIVFNLYDVFFQIISIPFVLLVVVLSLLLDILTVNAARITARTILLLPASIMYLRRGIEDLCCHEVTWYVNCFLTFSLFL